MHQNLEIFVRQWDTLSANAHGRFSTIDCLQWFNYLAFDIIGDLAFGAPFGMLAKAKDITEIQLEPGAAISYVPAVEVLNRRGEVSGTLGCLPQLKPYAKWLPDPFFSKGLAAVENLAGIAVARVSQRLEGKQDTDRVDLLARLMQGKDETGAKLGRAELTAEALTQLIAGSDTTSNTSCAILYWATKTPGVVEKLQCELDVAIPTGTAIPSYDMVKDLPYLRSVINETLRIHSTSSLGLPRVVPVSSTGITILGHHFAPGTVLSVPAYTVHHAAEIWGPDVESFVPERWERLTDAQKDAFIPFSYGPRSCVGRNVAEMELALIIGTAFRRYEFDLHQETLETREGFLRKPLECLVGLRKRANA